MKNFFRLYKLLCLALIVFIAGCQKNSTPTCNNSKNSVLITRDLYSLCFDAELKQPGWVLQVINANSFPSPPDVVLQEYHPDPKIPLREQASVADYSDNQWVIGNFLFPFDPEEKLFSDENFSDMFLFSVTSPQDHGFHQGYWKILRGRVEKFAKAKDIGFVGYNVAVLSGPLFLKAPSERTFMGNNHVPVPTHFFQVIFPTANPEDIEVYVVPNENIEISKPLNDFKVSLQEFEKLSSIKDVKGVVGRLIHPAPFL